MNSFVRRVHLMGRTDPAGLAAFERKLAEAHQHQAEGELGLAGQAYWELYENSARAASLPFQAFAMAGLAQIAEAAGKLDEALDYLIIALTNLQALGDRSFSGEVSELERRHSELVARGAHPRPMMP
jgi:hypothetical protein